MEAVVPTVQNLSEGRMRHELYSGVHRSLCRVGLFEVGGEVRGRGALSAAPGVVAQYGVHGLINPNLARWGRLRRPPLRLLLRVLLREVVAHRLLHLARLARGSRSAAP